MFAEGRDDRCLTVIPEIQSIGVQLSYGVRCANRNDVLTYMTSLCRVSDDDDDDHDDDV